MNNNNNNLMDFLCVRSDESSLWGDKIKSLHLRLAPKGHSVPADLRTQTANLKTAETNTLAARPDIPLGS